jgi:hypothetical protein
MLHLKVRSLPFHGFHTLLVIVVDLTSGDTGFCDDVDAGVGPCQMLPGEPSTGFGDDDDKQIVQCLQHVKKILILLCFFYDVIASFISLRLLI